MGVFTQLVYEDYLTVKLKVVKTTTVKEFIRKGLTDTGSRE